MITNNQAVMNPQYGYAVKPTRPMGKHSCWRVTVIVMVFFIYLAAVVLSSLNSIPRDLIGELKVLFTRPRGSFVRTPDQIPHDLVPAIWVYWIGWPVQYFWNLLWLLYLLSTLCRHGYAGSYLYYDPPYMPMVLPVSFGMATLCGTAWLFLYDQLNLVGIWPPIIALDLEAIFCVVALAGSVYSLYKNEEELKLTNRGAEVGWAIGLVHNGLGMYTTWIMVDTIINLVALLIYQFGIQPEIAYVVGLSIFACAILLWFILDSFVFWKATLFLITPYVVTSLIFSGMLSRNWNLASPNAITIYLIVLLGISLIFLFLKLIFACARREKKPTSPRVTDVESAGGAMAYHQPTRKTAGRSKGRVDNGATLTQQPSPGAAGRSEQGDPALTQSDSNTALKSHYQDDTDQEIQSTFFFE